MELKEVLGKPAWRGGTRVASASLAHVSDWVDGEVISRDDSLEVGCTANMMGRNSFGIPTSRSPNFPG